MPQLEGGCREPRPGRPHLQTELLIANLPLGTGPFDARNGSGQRARCGHRRRPARRRQTSCGDSHPGLARLDDFAVTQTLPVPGSTVHTISDPGPTPNNAATGSGIVARTDEDPSTVRTALDVKARGNNPPVTLMGGRLNDFALDVGLPIRQTIMYPKTNTIGQTVGQYMGRNTIVLNTPRAQRSLQLLASSAEAVIHLSRTEIRVQRLSGRGYYTVRRQGIASRWVCECPDFQKSPEGCVHAWAAELSFRIQAAFDLDGPPPQEVEISPAIPACPSGGAHITVRDGHRECHKGTVQRFRCRTCGRRFIIDHVFARIHSAPRFVVAAVDLWAKKVSYRQIADHFRGVYLIRVTKSTIQRWVKRIIRLLAAFDKACHPVVGGLWHCDETMQKVGGRYRYVWNLMDHKTRYWLASPISDGRTVEDARVPLRIAREVAGVVPQALVTDGYPPYRLAVRKELYSNTCFAIHLIIPPIRKTVNNGLIDLHPGNNINERLQGTLRDWTKAMRGFKTLATAQEQIDGFRAYQNLVKPHAGLGGRTPAECAGVPIATLANEGRLMSVIATADAFIKRRMEGSA